MIIMQTRQYAIAVVSMFIIMIYFCSIILSFAGYVYVGTFSENGFIYVSSSSGLLEIGINLIAPPRNLEVNSNFDIMDIGSIVHEPWLFKVDNIHDVTIVRCSYDIIVLALCVLIAILLFIYHKCVCRNTRKDGQSDLPSRGSVLMAWHERSVSGGQ